MLRRASRIVASVMGKHIGRIHLLAEFWDDRSSLGDMKKGKKTGRCSRVRLRVHKFPAIFLPLDVVVQTLLHELSHVKFSKHDLDFFSWNAELFKKLLWDLEEKMEKGEVRREEVPVRATHEEELMLMEQLEVMAMAEGGEVDVDSLEGQMAKCAISE